MNKIITLSGSESPESARRKQRKYERSSLHQPITSESFLRNLKNCSCYNVHNGERYSINNEVMKT